MYSLTALTYVYTCETITTLKIMNKSITSHISKDGFIIIPTLQIRKLRHKEVISFGILAQDPTGVDPDHDP